MGVVWVGGGGVGGHSVGRRVSVRWTGLWVWFIVYSSNMNPQIDQLLFVKNSCKIKVLESSSICNDHCVKLAGKPAFGGLPCFGVPMTALP